ncbi:MAG TPA: hypothetical protein VF352_09990 [Anaerolineales bacterium]
MKFRLTIFVVLLSLSFTACSLAEDITPPAGYSSPTSISTIVPATQTPEPPSTATFTPTSESVATTTQSTPATTDSTTPSAEVSPTAQPSVVVIDGTVTVASGGTIPDGTIANLLIIVTTTGQITQTLTTPILPDGKYEFTNVPVDTTTVYLVTVDYKGVTYESSPVQFDGTLFQFNMPITVYDTTNDQNVLTVTQAHLQFGFSTAGQVQVMVLYVISNPGGNAVIVPSDGTTVPFIQIPEGAQSLNFQLAQSSSPLMSATNGFALLPGADKQYGIIATFNLPYTNRLVYTQPFILPVSSATIIVPEGVRVSSDQLTDAGTQASTGTTYHLYQGSSLASGSTLTLTISGMPGDKAGFVLDQRTWLMIGVGTLGLLLIGLGIFLFLRDRRLRKLEEEFDGDDEEGDEDALGDDRESIMDAIIALDDQYKAGDISKEAYEKRRDELKERLKNLA